LRQAVVRASGPPAAFNASLTILAHTQTSVR
jgi:hypothetical protein